VKEKDESLRERERERERDGIVFLESHEEGLISKEKEEPLEKVILSPFIPRYKKCGHMSYGEWMMTYYK
jgi:hypothetical protein